MRLDRISENESSQNIDMAGKIFREARKHNKTGRIFRLCSRLDSERKMIIAFTVHMIATLTLFLQFYMLKYNQKSSNVSKDDDLYIYKVFIPSLQSGSEHSILFQMVFLPLTMCRYSITSLSPTSIGTFIPFHRMVKFHIHLGHVMCIIVFLSTISFFTNFGILCYYDEPGVCEKFSSEIFITGCLILALLITIYVTSVLRHRIPYEIFYYFHHCVFVMYIINILHTYDDKERNGTLDRSQSYKWFTGALLYYICDRLTMHFNKTYTTDVEEAIRVSGSSGTRAVILKLKRPAPLQFQPGHYAFLRVKQIDALNWHPFTIASAPSSDTIEFFIEVFGEDSWTNKLFKLAGLKTSNFTMEIMGPCGTDFGTNEYSHAVAVGSGTGIVPMMSLLRQHVEEMRMLEPSSYFMKVDRRNQKLINYYKTYANNDDSLYQRIRCGKKEENQFRASVINAIQNESRNQNEPSSNDGNTTAGGRGISRATSTSVLRECYSLMADSNGISENLVQASLDYIRVKASQAYTEFYGKVLMMIVPMFGATMFCLSLSWNLVNDQIELFQGADIILAIGTILFQYTFLLSVFFVHSTSEFLTFIDYTAVIVGLLADCYWFFVDSGQWGNFPNDQILFYSVLIGYMTLRSWSTAVYAMKTSSLPALSKTDTINVLNDLHFIWVVRSASLASQVLPDIVDEWQKLSDSWGRSKAMKVCRVSIYVTDKNQDACDEFDAQFQESCLCGAGDVIFARPNFQQILEEDLLRRIAEEDKLTAGKLPTKTLVAFCGSPSLSTRINQAVTEVRISAVTSGNGHHDMHFLSESFGANVSTAKPNYASEPKPSNDAAERPSQRPLNGRGLASAKRESCKFKFNDVENR